tara:strand:+ start:18025 stop:24426 length:6402 start_codon:yes stop_codon:yes gene_type:complete
MSEESKFLKWQDPDGDKLPDVCNELVDVEPSHKCPPCVPNPYALVADWKTSTEALWNAKTCQYEVGIITDIESFFDSDGNKIIDEEKLAANGTPVAYEQYEMEAVENILDTFNKDTSEQSIAQVKNNLAFNGSFLDEAPKSRLKIAFAVDYIFVASLDDAPPLSEEESDSEDQEEEDEENENTITTTIKYSADDLTGKLLKVRRGLNLYNKYLKIYRALDGGNLVFSESRLIFNLEDYGDSGIFNGSLLAKALSELDKFVSSKGYNITMVGAGGLFRDKVTSIELNFNSSYKLLKLKIWSAGCGDTPIVFGRKKLKNLNQQEAFRDPTAMAYLSKLNEMEQGLAAREPTPWLQFVKEFTYPEVFDTFDFPVNRDDVDDTTSSCIADALRKESKQLGQDILDNAFSIGDAVSYAFHKNTCKRNIEDMRIEDLKLGLSYKPGTATPDHTIWAMAKQQAFQEIEENDQIFAGLCAGIIGEFEGAGLAAGGMNLLISIYFDGLFKLKKCGLSSLMLDAMKCLMAGLTLEEAMGSILSAALRGMDLENFGDLFQNLPPEQQGRISEVAEARLASLFKPGSYNEQLSASVDAGGLYQPWQVPELVEADKSDAPQSETSQSNTLARKYADKTDQQQTPVGTVMEAWVGAVIEVYVTGANDSGLSLVDMLNKYPGAQLIANIIALFDCPTQPMMDPPLMEYIKDVNLPFCRDIWDLQAPKFSNPFGWLPDIKDWPKILFQLLKEALIQAVIMALMKLLIKLCGTIGGSMCKAIEATGKLATSALDSSEKAKFGDIVKSAICGDNASDEKVDNTIKELFETLGIGATALSDSERVMQFTEDLSNSVTQMELTNAFIGKASPEFLTIVNNLIEYEYPDFREGLSNKQAIGSFFNNCGNLFPADFRDQLKNMPDAMQPTDLPANPILCATPEDIEGFCNLRTELLKDRVGEDAARQMCEDLRQGMQDDLEDIGNILQGGLPDYIANNMPPLVSEPGCDDGLIPFESDQAIAAAQQAVKSDFESLKTAFSKDMLNNGPGERNWGLLNMILSDTMGQPLTAHYRKVYFQPRTVDFYTNPLDEEDDSGRVSSIKRQRSAFPARVAGWLYEQFNGSTGTSDSNTSDLRDSLIFESNNDFQQNEMTSQTFDDLDIKYKTFQLISFPDLGYNVQVLPKPRDEKMLFLHKARKKTADMTLVYKDNNRGLRTSEDSGFDYGFNIEMFLSDLQGVGDLTGSNGYGINRRDDNMRVKINNLLNVSALRLSPLSTFVETDGTIFSKFNSSTSILTERKYEFLSTDDTLDNFNYDNFPKFARCFTGSQDYLPQIVLLKELIDLRGSVIVPGASAPQSMIDTDTVKTFYDSFVTNITSDFASVLAANTSSFNYGARYDDLSEDDIEYVMPSGYRDAGIKYSDAQIQDASTGEWRYLTNDDMIMGVSRMQYELETGTYTGLAIENRVFYLDPRDFGGTYMNPAVYIKPQKNEGWLGMVNMMFPELSPCKPQRTDLIDFDEISNLVGDIYATMAPDPRLKLDSDCLVQKPYNRLLERKPASTIEGIIIAACRIFAATHFLKTLTTFTVFKPDFKNVFSSIYAQYIIEAMEESFKDSAPDFLEAFSTFKDEEFWYAFLEQSVQMYGRRIDNGTIPDPPQWALKVLRQLNKNQEDYSYPSKEDLKKAKDLDQVRKIKTLRNYRQDKNLQAIFNTEDKAKLILKEILQKELQVVADKFVSNLEGAGFKPTINRLDYYLLQNYCQGQSLDLDKDIKEEAIELPTTDVEFQYTGGGEFSVYEVRATDSPYKQGEDYVGYYHVHVTDSGDVQYMTGPEHVSAPHDLLKPMASKMIVPIGDVAEYGASYDNTDTTPFLVEKYISINGTKYSPADAVSIILQNESTLNLSEVYPGDMEQVVDSGGMVVGVKGQLGVLYGLRFSIVIEGTRYTLTTTELSALDLPISEFPPLEADSKLLLCLINMMVDSGRFKLITDYILPMRKILSSFAIYNDMAFLPSIGQITVSDGDTYGKSSDMDTKPGMSVSVEGEAEDAIISLNSVDGWASLRDRDGPWTPFVTTWDEWDQELLGKSCYRLKRLFKGEYNSRNYKAGEFPDWGINGPGQMFMRQMRANMLPRPGIKLLPWWKRRKLRSNPFDANGKLCEKDD